MPFLTLFLPGIILANFGGLFPGRFFPGSLDTVAVDVVTVTVSGQRSPVVVLKESDSSRALPIVIGPYEADAIWARLANRSYPRPLTHDLLKNALESSRVRLKQVVIYKEKGGVYYAFLSLERRGRRFRVDSRPSDGIALALRSGAPIMVARHLMASKAAFDMESNPAPVRLQGVTLQQLTPELAERLGVATTRGALVADVRRGRFAGILRRGDVILEIDGKAADGVVETLQLIQAMDPAMPGRVRVLREKNDLELKVPALQAGKK